MKALEELRRPPPPPPPPPPPGRGRGGEAWLEGRIRLVSLLAPCAPLAAELLKGIDSRHRRPPRRVIAAVLFCVLMVVRLFFSREHKHLLLVANQAAARRQIDGRLQHPHATKGV